MADQNNNCAACGGRAALKGYEKNLLCCTECGSTVAAPAATPAVPVPALTELDALSLRAARDWIVQQGAHSIAADIESAIVKVESLAASQSVPAPDAPTDLTQLTRAYNSGYKSGHHDTVEGQYTDIDQRDMFTYHADTVADMIADGTLAAPDVGGLRNQWQPISTLPYADDLVWLKHGDTIDGPRPMDTDDYDRWSEWAPCTWPLDNVDSTDVGGLTEQDERWVPAEQAAFSAWAINAFPNESSEGLISLGSAWKQGQAYALAAHPADAGAAELRAALDELVAIVDGFVEDDCDGQGRIDSLTTQPAHRVLDGGTFDPEGVPADAAPEQSIPEVERLKAAKANLIQQARMWRGEARAQRATVLSILRRLGLPEHDWEAKRLIVSHIQRLTQSAEITTAEFPVARNPQVAPVIDDATEFGRFIAWSERFTQEAGGAVMAPRDAWIAAKREAAIQAAPEATIDPAFIANLARSRVKYPNNRSMLDGLCGELHELKRAYNGDGDVRAEAFDVAVCAYRLAVEGDAGGNQKLGLIPDSFAWGAAPEATSEQLETMLIQQRIAITPEYEGGFVAEKFGDEEIASAKGYGATPSEAIAAMTFVMPTYTPAPPLNWDEETTSDQPGGHRQSHDERLTTIRNSGDQQLIQDVLAGRMSIQAAVLKAGEQMGGAQVASADLATILEDAAKLVLADLVPGRTDKLDLKWVTHNAAVMHAAEVIRAFAVTKSVAEGAATSELCFGPNDPAWVYVPAPPLEWDEEAPSERKPLTDECEKCNGTKWVMDLHDMEQGLIACPACKGIEQHHGIGSDK